VVGPAHESQDVIVVKPTPARHTPATEDTEAQSTATATCRIVTRIGGQASFDPFSMAAIHVSQPTGAKKQY